jgi:ribonuclease P protein component
VLGQNNQKSYARLGLAIARKHVKKAVSRNRIKRLVRESFRQHQKLLAGLDIVVTLRGDASRLDNNMIRQSLIKHWHSLITKCEKYS